MPPDGEILPPITRSRERFASEHKILAGNLSGWRKRDRCRGGALFCRMCSERTHVGRMCSGVTPTPGRRKESRIVFSLNTHIDIIVSE